MLCVQSVQQEADDDDDHADGATDTQGSGAVLPDSGGLQLHGLRDNVERNASTFWELRAWVSQRGDQRAL